MNEVANLVIRATAYAIQMHGNQTRKYTNEPYVLHTLEVARLIAPRPGVDTAMICAAILHDTVEDTAASPIDIRANFGERIGMLVHWLTDISTPSDGNRAARKTIDREHIANAPADAKTIKLADMISNTSTIVRYDRGFARTYIPEKRLLLDVLTEGDRELWNIAYDQVNAAVRELGL